MNATQSPRLWEVGHVTCRATKTEHAEVVDARGEIICQLHTKSRMGLLISFSNAEANARILAEAPAMFAAIEECVRLINTPHLDIYDYDGELIEDMRKIVARINEPF